MGNTVVPIEVGLRAESEVPEDEVPRAVGLWMAGETEAEINLRHLEAHAAPEAPLDAAGVEGPLFEQTVDRMMELRPSLSRAQAAAAVRRLSRG